MADAVLLTLTEDSVKKDPADLDRAAEVLAKDIVAALELMPEMEVEQKVLQLEIRYNPVLELDIDENWVADYEEVFNQAKGQLRDYVLPKKIFMLLIGEMSELHGLATMEREMRAIDVTLEWKNPKVAMHSLNVRNISNARGVGSRLYRERFALCQPNPIFVSNAAKGDKKRVNASVILKSAVASGYRKVFNVQAEHFQESQEYDTPTLIMEAGSEDFDKYLEQLGYTEDMNTVDTFLFEM